MMVALLKRRVVTIAYVLNPPLVGGVWMRAQLKLEVQEYQDVLSVSFGDLNGP